MCLLATHVVRPANDPIHGTRGLPPAITAHSPPPQRIAAVAVAVAVPADVVVVVVVVAVVLADVVVGASTSTAAAPRAIPAALAGAHRAE